MLSMLVSLLALSASSYGQMHDDDLIDALKNGDWQYTFEGEFFQNSTWTLPGNGCTESGGILWDLDISGNGTILKSAWTVDGEFQGTYRSHIYGTACPDGIIRYSSRECNSLAPSNEFTMYMWEGTPFYQHWTDSSKWIVYPVVAGSLPIICQLDDNEPQMDYYQFFDLINPTNVWFSTDNMNLQSYVILESEYERQEATSRFTYTSDDLPQISFTYRITYRQSDPNPSSVGVFSMTLTLVSKQIDLVDPHNDIVNPRDFASQVDTWATSTQTVEGVAADSTTRVVVRIPASDAVSANLTITAKDGLGGDIGQICPLSQTNCGLFQDLSVINTVDGDYFLGIYKAPRNFVRSEAETADKDATDRYVYIEAELKEADGTLTTTIHDSIKIVRPPVVLIHGLWGDEGSFQNDFLDTLKDGDRRLVYFRSFESTNHLGLDQNSKVVERRVKEALGQFRQETSNAASQVDVVAHSMGRVLARLYIQSDLFKRPENYLEGDIYRLITLNTPHGGTPIADLLRYLAENCLEYGYDCSITTSELAFEEINPFTSLRELGCMYLKYIECMDEVTTGKPDAFFAGGVRDLTSNSPRIGSLLSTPVMSHAFNSNVVGSSPSSHAKEEKLFGTLNKLYRQVVGSNLTPASPEEFYCSVGHDYVVPLTSQLGGIGNANQTPLGDESHTDVSNSTHAATIRDLLRLRRGDPKFGNFPDYAVGNSCMPPPFPSMDGSNQEMLFAKNATSENIATLLTLSLPATDWIAQPGGTIQIEVDVDYSGPIELVLLGDGIISSISQAPYETTWEIPDDAIGQVSFILLAMTEDEIVGGAGPFTFPVELGKPLVRLELSPQYLSLSGPNDVDYMSLVGVWSDSVHRNVSNSDLGTVYTSLDPSIAVINSRGLVTAVSEGSTQITGSFGNEVASATVVVESNFPIPPADTTPPVIEFRNTCPDTVCEGDELYLVSLVEDDESGILYQTRPDGEYMLNANGVGRHHFFTSASDSSGNFVSLVCSYTVISCCDSGSIAGFVLYDSIGLLGVPIDLYDSNGAIILSSVSDDSGWYSFDSLAPGDYSLSISTPLGYEANQETQTVELCEPIHSIDFDLTALGVVPQQRSRGYWAHQLHRALKYNPADYAIDDFAEFAGLINVHFNSNDINPVDFYEVLQPADQNDSLIILKKLLHMRNAGEWEPFLKRLAKSQLMALMLNVVSGKVSQLHEVSADSITVSQAITYCDMLVNDEIASPNDGGPGHGSRWFRYIRASYILLRCNLSLIVPSGMIPNDIIQIAYRLREQERLPTDFTLNQNYPNPFNPSTTISFYVPQAMHVKLEVFNVLGQRVETLGDSEMEAGHHRFVWDGDQVASGIYLYRLSASGFVGTRKMLLLK